MKVRSAAVSVLLLGALFILPGCVVRTYEVTKDRVDQDLSAGNRGYLMGQPPAATETKEKKMTRQTHVMEIELRSPIKFEKLKKSAAAAGQEDAESGALRESSSGQSARQVSAAGRFQAYTVQKGDTLQKISQKFYGTTKKWPKIFDANRESLSSPNSIYPGQALNIPLAEMKETEENLK